MPRSLGRRVISSNRQRSLGIVNHRHRPGVAPDWDPSFDVHAQKIALDLSAAIFQAPNNYPRLGVEVPQQGVRVAPGLRRDEGGALVGRDEIIAELRRSEADTLLYSLPTGMQWAAEG